MANPDTITPYWLERRWNQVKGRFNDLRTYEEAYTLNFVVMEEQAAFMAVRHPELTGTEIGLAYMLTDLHVRWLSTPS